MTNLLLILAEVSTFKNTTLKIALVVACILLIAVCFFGVMFLFWNAMFYGVYKKYRLDEEINIQNEDLEKIKITKFEITEEINKLLNEKQQLQDKNNNLKIAMDEISKELEIAKKNIKKDKKKEKDE